MIDKMNKMEQVVGVKIPDDDMVGWITTLREAGLSEREADKMLIRLNETYRNMKGKEFFDENRINWELENIQKEYKKEFGRELDEEAISAIKRDLENKFLE